jgi:hypothetical protein
MIQGTPMADIARLAECMRAEYEAFPRLTLTVVQASRRWSADAAACRAAFEVLVAEGVLWLAPSGRYVALPRPGGEAAAVDATLVRCPRCRRRNAFPRDEAIHGRDISGRLRCAGCNHVFTVRGTKAAG